MAFFCPAQPTTFAPNHERFLSTYNLINGSNNGCCSFAADPIFCGSFTLTMSTVIVCLYSSTSCSKFSIEICFFLSRPLSNSLFNCEWWTSIVKHQSDSNPFCVFYFLSVSRLLAFTQLRCYWIVLHFFFVIRGRLCYFRKLTHLRLLFIHFYFAFVMGERKKKRRKKPIAI